MSAAQTPQTLHEPRLVVLAGPTAVGKGTVSAYIRTHFPQVYLSVSMTTRPPRPGEVDGVHYHFVAPQEFDRVIVNDDVRRASEELVSLMDWRPSAL